MLTNEHFNDIIARYDGLIHTVANNISGDIAISHHDDNVQELYLTIIQTVETFARLNDYESYDDFKDTPGWNKYIKTALWNNKNARGKKISKKYGITRDTVTVHGNEEVLQMADAAPECFETKMFLEELSLRLDEREMLVVRTILNNECYIKPNGKINRLSLSEDLEMSWQETDRILNDLSIKLNNDL